MALGPLYNISTDADFSAFAFANADHHTLVTQAINQNLPASQALTFYILDPIPDFDLQNWLRRHQQSHNDINSALGIQGTDLTDVNFKKQDEREAWAELHASEHIQWQLSTGID